MWNKARPIKKELHDGFISVVIQFTNDQGKTIDKEFNIHDISEIKKKSIDAITTLNLFDTVPIEDIDLIPEEPIDPPDPKPPTEQELKRAKFFKDLQNLRALKEFVKDGILTNDNVFILDLESSLSTQFDPEFVK